MMTWWCCCCVLLQCDVLLPPYCLCAAVECLITITPSPSPTLTPLAHFAVREFVAWWPKYPFLSGADLEAWGRITWWEGPDRSGRLWLMIDNRAAVSASRAHGADVVARVVISNVSGGARRRTAPRRVPFAHTLRT